MPCACLAHMKDRGDIGLQKTLKCICRKVFQRGAVLHPCIVYKDIEWAGRCFEPVNSCAHRIMIGCIKGKCVNG